MPLRLIGGICFLWALSWGIMVPDVQVRVKGLGAEGAWLGFVLASLSIAQLLAAPPLSRWSDLTGRRRVLLICAFASLIGFFGYGLAGSPTMVLFARVFLGIGGALVPIAFAYVADSSSAEQRVTALGKIGAALALGFIVGAPIGGAISERPGSSAWIFGGAGIVITILYAALILRLPDSKPRAPQGSLFTGITRVLESRLVMSLVIVFLVAEIAFSLIESTFINLHVDHFQSTARTAGMMIGIMGICEAITQGIGLRALQAKVPVGRLIFFGLTLQALTLGLIPFAPVSWGTGLVVAVIGVGIGMANPCIAGLISWHTSPEDQGGLFGVAQACTCIGRIVGPITANMLYTDVRFWAPYVLASALLIVPMIITLRKAREVECSGPVRA